MSLEQILYIVATPIGNRDDISVRAIDVLRNVDRIYAEDTRHSLPLLRHHGIDTRLWPLHEHNEQSQLEHVIAYLREGNSAALITDAGTPLISDPGYRLVRACRNTGINVSPVPGPCAVVSALSVCGLPTDRFQFVGFSPHRSAARKLWLMPLAQLTHTLVMYESPHRIVDSLSDIVEVFGQNRMICVARELTKKFETIIHGEASVVAATISRDLNQQKGEFVIVLSGQVSDDQADEQARAELDTTLKVLLSYLPVKQAAKAAAEIFSIKKRTAYERALQIQGKV